MTNFPVADGHCDFLYGMVQYGYALSAPKHGQTIRLNDMQQGGVAIQFFAAWIDMKLRTPPLDQCLMMLDAYERMLDSHPELTRMAADFSPESGRIATVLAVEGGEAVDGSCAILRTLYRLGIRAMTLTWNDNNELAGAAMANGNKGLSPMGRAIIDEMSALGMAIDVSHLSDRGIDEVLKHTDRPIFASHSNARSVHASARSLCDDHIRAIAERGGTVGVNFYHKQLCKGKDATIADIVQHIQHIVSVGGEDCCAIGSDFDGMERYPLDMQTSRDFPAIAQALLDAGFSKEAVRKILYDNLRRYILQFV